MSIISNIMYKLHDTLFWKYSNTWDAKNEEDYLNGNYYEEELFIVAQKIIPAKTIDMEDYDIGESNFPWHGHTLDDFCRLNNALQNCIAIVERIRSPREVKKFRRKYREVYDAYFRRPIYVYQNRNSGYSFGCDGRHRIFAAKQADGMIPVWVVEYKDPRNVSLEYYKKHAFAGSWRFLGELQEK